MTSPAQPLFAIEAEGLTKRFGDTLAVDALDLRIPHGTVFGFLGPNGAGKSTTIRMLMGLTRPSTGRAAVLGEELVGGAHASRARVGYVPELPHVYRWMRVREAIGFCRSFYGTWNDDLCRELLSIFGLGEGKVVGTLSKGSLSKLGLLLAISHEPEVLILDEPTAGLDPLVREEFLDGVLAEICRRPQTVLFSSHTLGDVQRLADTVGILHEGRMLVTGATDDLLASTKRVRAVVPSGKPFRDPPPGTIWQEFNAREWKLTVHGFTLETLAYLGAQDAVQVVEVQDLTLEEIFKDYIKGRRARA